MSQSTRPTIVCLCGSTRFFEKFMEANYLETMAGRIVLSVGFFMHRPDTQHGEVVGCTPEQKIALDDLHKRKIDLCDEIYVLNVGGYIGSSTRSEIEYAQALSKPIRYLEREEVNEHASNSNRGAAESRDAHPDAATEAFANASDR